MTNSSRLFERMIISPRRLVDTPSRIMIPGYPLESLQIEPDRGWYISELSGERQRAEALGYGYEGRLRGLGGWCITSGLGYGYGYEGHLRGLPGEYQSGCSHLGAVWIDTMFKFCQERPISVMNLLIENVRLNLRHRSFAEGKGTVGSLPFEEVIGKNCVGYQM
jgi:hypothetical protein